MRSPTSAKIAEVMDCITRFVGSAVVSVVIGVGTLFIFYALGLPASPTALVLLGLIGGGMVFPRRQRMVATVSLSVFWAVSVLALWLWIDELNIGTDLLVGSLQGSGYAIGVSLLWVLWGRAEPADQTISTPAQILMEDRADADSGRR